MDVMSKGNGEPVITNPNEKFSRRFLNADGGSLHSVMHQWELIPWSIAGFGKLKAVQVVMNVPALYGSGWFI
jgi:hypothetical protein